MIRALIVAADDKQFEVTTDGVQWLSIDKRSVHSAL
jgi:hypothetical protein